MEASFVSRAKTAFHSAAAKAEKVFTDIKKPDPIIDPGDDSDKQSNAKDESQEDHEVKKLRRRPAPIKTKNDWHGRFKNIRIGKRGVEDPEKAENSAMAYAIFDENLYLMSEREFPQSKDSNFNSTVEGLCDSNSDIIPPIAVMKQLAVAVEAAKNFKSMRDLLASSRDSSPVRERASLSFSAVKSLVLREKEEKLSTEFGNNEKVLSVLKSLLDAEGQFPGWKTGSGLGALTNITSLPKDIHGAPPDSFVVKVSEAIGSLKTLRKMASLWSRIVAELRRLWSEGQYIPGVPPDQIPDLSLCLLYQQLQVINCCVSRKKRRSAATESLESVLRQGTSNIEVSSVSEDAALVHSILVARISTGELVPRLGADKQSGSLTMLETGEPIYTPVLQEVPLLTEDLIKETEEFVLRTGSVGAGCSQLLSDMQAFKAANPGCILEDFVRWHSPPDWLETDVANEVNETSDGGDLLSSRGQLSRRMQKEGNLWRELWETAKPVPAVQQTPLFDEDLAVEGILNWLEDITPPELFEPLFISLLGTGFVIAEATLSTNPSLSKLFNECRNYIVATCQGGNWVDKVDDICQVYETVETMLLNPDEVIKVTVQPEETTTAGELKNRFKKISLIFGSKDRHSGKTPPSKDQKNTDENTVRQSISSIFSKKPPKPSSGSPADKPLNSVENDWTIV